MDWASIIAAAIGGGLGALIGGALGHWFFPKKPGVEDRRATVRTVLLVVFMIVGLRAAPSLMNAYFGEALRDLTGQTAAVESELDEFMASPFIKAIVEANPAAEAQIRKRMLDAFRRDGQDGLSEEGYRIGQDYATSLFPQFVPRARAEDLLAFGQASVDVTRVLSERAPELCYAWLYDPASFSQTRFAATVPPETLETFVGTLTAIITEAQDTAPQYDSAAVQIALQRVVLALQAAYPQSAFALISQQRKPASTQESRQACDLTADIYAGVLEQDNAADILRFMFSSAG